MISPGAYRPWLDRVWHWLERLEPLSSADRLARLCQWSREAGLANAAGLPIRFVAAEAIDSHPGEPGSGHALAMAYESRIFHSGEVPTRTQGSGARHDLYNALAWLTWPLSKARLNALHLEAGAEAVGNGRGAVRDAATLFDENAVLWIGEDESLEAALREFRWKSLFVEQRETVTARVRVAVFGHALLHKLDAPYKAITAHAWPLRVPASTPADEIDRLVASQLTAWRLSARALCPLPVMGLPGWCEANREPGFYDDMMVFRPGRRRGPTQAGATGQAGRGAISSGHAGGLAPEGADPTQDPAAMAKALTRHPSPISFQPFTRTEMPS